MPALLIASAHRRRSLNVGSAILSATSRGEHAMRLIPTRGGRRTTTVAFDARRVSLGVLALIAFSAPPASALSVFDAIQLSKRGYSDQAIIDLIEATDSAFDLEAEDLPKLKQLGVSEPVIRAMLKRAVGEGRDSGEAGAAAAPHETGGVRKSEPSSTHADVVGTPPHDRAHRASTPISDSPFTAHPLREERAGGHFHLALALDGVELLVLRDEGGYASIETRGRAVVGRLREAWAAGRGRFQAARAASGAQVVFRAGADERKQQMIRVLTVSAGDARAYELRSGRSVTPDLLAMYWADLFSDFWAVAHGEPPERLLGLHEGEALRVLREALAQLDGPDGTLRAAAELVPSSTRHHLQRLARAVPIEYGPRGAH